MSTLVKERRFSLTDQSEGNNNHKFWNVEIYDDGQYICRWGRQGDNGQSKTFQKGSLSVAESEVEKKIRGKERKGYSENEFVDSATTSNISVKSVAKSGLESIAQNQIRYNNKNVATLVKYLTSINAHDITSKTGGQISFNDTTGLFSTEQGVVSQNTIDKANNILVDIGDLVSKGNYDGNMIPLTNQYLMLIPQKIGRRGLIHTDFWKSLEKVQDQKQILDSLQASLVSASTQPGTKKTKKVKEEQIFDVQLDLVESGKTIDRIKKMYHTSRQSAHACQHLDVKKVYSVDINTVSQAFENDGKKLDEIWELWHGTRASNLLSILKGGLIIPPSSSSHCTGRMFGNGVYASDQSTKALNYAYGYWDGNRKDNNCFMFLLDMAMGDYHVPKSYGRNFPVKGSDSTFAKARQSGVGNNEMIVYRTSQVNLKYLIEFSPHGK
jgi:poly [ADP-ribose] polymerase